MPCSKPMWLPSDSLLLHSHRELRTSSGVPDDFDGELTHFEWSELNGSISNPYLHMLQAQCEALVTMRPILVENGDKGGELVLEPSVLLQDDVVNLTKGQFAGLLKNGVKYHA